MARGDFALLLPLSPVLLALASCASEPEAAERSGEARSSPFDFEMAMAGAGAAARVGTPPRQHEGRIIAGQEAGQPGDHL